MNTQKNTGSYYTPEFLSTFITKYILENTPTDKHLSILEPSVGDGAFIRAIKNINLTFENVIFEAVEKSFPELQKAKVFSKQFKQKIKFNFYSSDFLEWQKNINNKYSIIIGNPPYIKKELLEKEQVEECKSIHLSASLTESSIKNIWSSFLIRCTQLLEEDGKLAFVLPAELLQVKFTEQIRSFLNSHFKRIEIFTFDELLFETIGQDTVILVGYKRSDNPGLFYTNIQDKNQLKEKSFKLAPNNALVSTNTKWTHHILTSEEIELLFKLRNKLSPLSFYCTSKPGIVTAANNYFIVDKETEEKYSLSDYTVPIIQKGQFVNGKVAFEPEDLHNLLASNKPSRFLKLKEEDFESFNEGLLKYLIQGEEEKLPERYKCKKRRKWYVVPGVPSKSSDILFFKRCHTYPKLLANTANVLVTDSAYMVDLAAEYSVNDFIFSFYNSLTLAFAELEGRYYGGGVLELTPNEFRGLPIPMVNIGNECFNSYCAKFKSKNLIDDILNEYNNKILSKSLRMSIEEIESVEAIRKKLLSKRLRK